MEERDLAHYTLRLIDILKTKDKTIRNSRLNSLLEDVKTYGSEDEFANGFQKLIMNFKEVAE